MEEIKLLAPIIFIMGSLMAGAILKVLLKKINVPYTVGLFVLGIILGYLNHAGVWSAQSIVAESLATAQNIDPELIINLFLPILIFSAAYDLDTHVFKRTLTNAVVLSVPGMVVAMLLTGALMMGIAHFAPAYNGWNWTFALMFGALISATDPVAVVALLKELGVSKRFSTLIDGESMLNDGTGIVLFMLFFAPFTSVVSGGDSHPVLEFLVVVFGGLLIGYIFAQAYLWYVKLKGVKGDSLLQTSMMILLSYVTFILAQDIFDLSGVIALVAFGLVIAYSGSASVDEKTNEFMKEFWELLSYIANTLIFIIIGVIIAEKVSFGWRDVAVLLAVYVGITLIRMAMITLFYPIMKRSGYGLNRRESVILCWGALRGALGLTLALMVSYTPSIPEEIRRQVLFLTSGIVTLTLVVNATTIKWMLSRLGLINESASRKFIMAEMRAQLLERSRQYIESLKGERGMSSVHWDEVEELLPSDAQVPSGSPQSKELIADLRLQIISRERQIYWSLFNGGVISIDAERKLAGALDHLSDGDGLKSLEARFETLEIDNKRSRIPLLKGNKFLRLIWAMSFKRSLVERYDVASALIIAQESALEYIDMLLSGQIVDERQTDKIKHLREEVESIICTAQGYIDELKESYPLTYSEATTIKGRRMLYHFERKAIDTALESGTIDQDAADNILSELRDLNNEEGTGLFRRFFSSKSNGES